MLSTSICILRVSTGPCSSSRCFEVIRCISTYSMGAFQSPIFVLAPMVSEFVRGSFKEKYLGSLQPFVLPRREFHCFLKPDILGLISHRRPQRVEAFDEK